MTYVLSELSETISGLVMTAAPLLAAIRTGPGQHISGIVWRPDLIVTTDTALPPGESFTLVLSTGMLATARADQRDPVRGLASLRVSHPIETPIMTPSARTAVGALVLVLAADFDGSPTVRLTAVHGQPRAVGQGVVLDLPDSRIDSGGLVLDPVGAVLGMVGVTPDGEAVVVPFHALARFLEGGVAPVIGPASEQPRPLYAPPRPAALATAPPPAELGQAGLSQAGLGQGGRARAASPMRPPTVALGSKSGERRAWLGVALQPITVPESLVQRAGQASGRLVVSVSPGGPADQAGLMIGDVVLSLNGQGAIGPNSLRGFLDTCRIGAVVALRVLRDTTVSSFHLTIAEHP